MHLSARNEKYVFICVDRNAVLLLAIVDRSILFSLLSHIRMSAVDIAEMLLNSFIYSILSHAAKNSIIK